jgi:hypothetical protein
MKYLKKIFENDLYNQVDEVELQDFCETYLAYLLDDTDFEIEVVDTESSGSKSGWDSYIIWLGKTLEYRRIQPFKWDDIKDYYIPFVTMLSREYDLNDKDLDQRGSSIIINFVSGDQLRINVDSIEDWGGRLHGDFETKFSELSGIYFNLVRYYDKKNQLFCYNGSGIKAIGIVVKNTIKL